MSQTTRSQISKLQAEKTAVQNSWLTRSDEETTRLIEAIDCQMVALYAAQDAEEGTEGTETATGHTSVNLGWTAEDLARATRKMVYRSKVAARERQLPRK